jgi:hypothetical protein
MNYWATLTVQQRSQPKNRFLLKAYTQYYKHPTPQLGNAILKRIGQQPTPRRVLTGTEQEGREMAKAILTVLTTPTKKLRAADAKDKREKIKKEAPHIKPELIDEVPDTELEELQKIVEKEQRQHIKEEPTTQPDMPKTLPPSDKEYKPELRSKKGGYSYWGSKYAAAFKREAQTPPRALPVTIGKVRIQEEAETNGTVRITGIKETGYPITYTGHPEKLEGPAATRFKKIYSESRYAGRVPQPQKKQDEDQRELFKGLCSTSS